MLALLEKTTDIEKCKCVFKENLEEETPTAFSENDTKTCF